MRHVSAAEQRSVASGVPLSLATSAAIFARLCAGDALAVSVYSVGSIPEHMKVTTFLNRLRHGPARQVLFRKVSSTVEEAIEIALVEEQFYNSASVMPWQKPVTERSAATPMEVGNAYVICYD